MAAARQAAEESQTPEETKSTAPSDLQSESIPTADLPKSTLSKIAEENSKAVAAKASSAATSIAGPVKTDGEASGTEASDATEGSSAPEAAKTTTPKAPEGTEDTKSPAATSDAEADTQAPEKAAEEGEKPAEVAQTGDAVAEAAAQPATTSETPAIAMIGTEVGVSNEESDPYFYDPGSSVGEVDGDQDSNTAYENYSSGYFSKAAAGEEAPRSARHSKGGSHGTHGAHDMHGSSGSHGKKRHGKGGIVALVIVLVLAALFAAYFTWEKQPSFCGAFCHTPMSSYYQSYESGDTTYGATACKAGGATCLSCHTLSVNDRLGMLKHEITGNYDYDSTTAELVGGTSAASQETCLLSGCHTDTAKNSAITTLDDLKAATSSMAYNPHDFSAHGYVECSSCHKMHAQSTYVCTQCHDGAMADLPSGWAAASIDSSVLDTSDSAASTASAAATATTGTSEVGQ